MDNKGWGLSSFLAILGVFVFCLAVVAIIIKFNFGPVKEEMVSPADPTSSNVKKSSENNREEDYIPLEELLKKSAEGMVPTLQAEVSSFIVTSNELIDHDFLDSLIDPNRGTACFGYVIYTRDTKKYEAYLRCPGSYRTKNYQMNFEGQENEKISSQ